MVGLPCGLRKKVTKGGSIYTAIKLAAFVLLFGIVSILFIVSAAHANGDDESTVTTSKQELVKVGHTVQKDQTLDDITALYLPPSNRGSHDAFLEFRESIYRENYDTAFKGRAPYRVVEGDYLIIQFWAVVDYN